jgi:hypothetical protein
VNRDTDKDDKSEAIGKVQSGYFGINFHPNTYDITADNTGATIGWWSQLDAKWSMTWINIVHLSRQPRRQKVVSYCLINEF